MQLPQKGKISGNVGPLKWKCRSIHVSDSASVARPVSTPTRRVGSDWARAASGHKTADPAIAFIKSRCRIASAPEVRATTDRLKLNLAHRATRQSTRLRSRHTASGSPHPLRSRAPPSLGRRLKASPRNRTKLRKLV